MRTLTEIRAEIDGIDQELVELFRRRLALMGEVAQAKKAGGIPLTDPSREQTILERLSKMAPGMEDKVRRLYTLIFQLSKECQ